MSESIELIEAMKAEAEKIAAATQFSTLSRKELAGILGVTSPVVTRELRKLNLRPTSGSRYVIPLKVAIKVINNYYPSN